MSKTLMFELSEEEAEFIHAEAAREERSVDEVMGDLVKQRMEYDAWFRRKVQEGFDALDRGEFFTHEDVSAHLEMRKAELIAKYGGK